MVFSSYVFLFYFLPLCLALYYAVPRRAKHLILTLASYVFYGWANPLFTVLLLTSTIIDYVSGLVIQREHTHNRDAWNDGDAHRNVGGPISRALPS
jgi:alginate O-acetyltransferase complex protein AlgI